MILKNTTNPNNIKKYQIFCISFIIFNIFAYQFTNFTHDENMTLNWYYCYDTLFQKIFGQGYNFDWILDWIHDFSWYIFLLTGILFIFKRKNRKFLVANIILQTLGILTQIVALWELWRYMFSSCWWYGDMTWIKTFFYLLNLIFGFILYRYYEKYQKDIDRTDFESYYLICIVCIILSFSLGNLYHRIWYNYLDPTRIR